MANVRYDAPVRQTPIGTHPNGASVFGIEDLAGGVWEWVADACTRGEGRVLEGGAWTLPPDLSRIGARDRTNAEAKGMMIGFRVARDMD